MHSRQCRDRIATEPTTAFANKLALVQPDNRANQGVDAEPGGLTLDPERASTSAIAAGGNAALVANLRSSLFAQARRLIARMHGNPLDADDLVHDFVVMLLEDPPRTLERWDASRGLSWDQFVAYLARRRMTKQLRNDRRYRRVFRACQEAADDCEAALEENPESIVSTRQSLQRAAVWLEENLTSQEMKLFESLVIDGGSARHLCDQTGRSRDSIYAWRSRLHKAMRGLSLRDLSSAGRPAKPPQPAST